MKIFVNKLSSKERNADILQQYQRFCDFCLMNGFQAAGQDDAEVQVFFPSGSLSQISTAVAIKESGKKIRIFIVNINKHYEHLLAYLKQTGNDKFVEVKQNIDEIIKLI